MSKYTELRGKLDKKTAMIIEIVGFFVLLGGWHLIATAIGSNSILPSPVAVIKSLGELYAKDSLFQNVWFSIKLNLWGYIEALLIAIPIGFLIGLSPVVGALSGKYVDSMRFIPLTAVIGLFVAWFGIGDSMKAHFLAFGIIVYLLPVVIQRIHETDKVYVQTAYTLGSTKWQTIRKVFFPDVMSKLFDDIRVLVAISWTYIIVAEMVNVNGGVGSMIFMAGRQARMDKVFAVLFVIIIIGFIQDKIFSYLDKILFPQKYV
jgi:NitT/TauT family transport system permease protein